MKNLRKILYILPFMLLLFACNKKTIALTIGIIVTFIIISVIIYLMVMI